MRELGHRFACRRLQSSAGIFTWTGQYELESPLSELVDHSRQGFKHGIRSARQTIVQLNDVPAGRFAQDSPGKNGGIRSECITRPNAPRNVLEAGLLKKRREKWMAQPHRRAEKAWAETTDTTDALGTAFDLSPQTTRHQKAEQRRVRPSVIGDQVSFCPRSAHYFRMLVGPLSDHKECCFHTFFP